LNFVYVAGTAGEYTYRGMADSNGGKDTTPFSNI